MEGAGGGRGRGFGSDGAFLSRSFRGQFARGDKALIRSSVDRLLLGGGAET